MGDEETIRDRFPLKKPKTDSLASVRDTVSSKTTLLLPS